MYECLIYHAATLIFLYDNRDKGNEKASMVPRKNWERNQDVGPISQFLSRSCVDLVLQTDFIAVKQTALVVIPMLY